MMSQSLIGSTQKDDMLSTTTHQLRDAINAAVRFLLEARDHEGWWKDYDIVVARMGDEWKATSSDEWVTAYIGSLLATVPDARVSEAIMGAWNLLKTTSRSVGGWGYSSISKPDASSTSWALQLAEAAGAGDSEQAQQAKAFLATHQRPNGGIACYATEERVRDFFKTPPHISVEGYFQAHTCVSAEVAALPEYRFRLRDYLKATQTSKGNWLCYWWSDHEYGTTYAAEALAACAQASDQPNIDLAVKWGVQRLSPQGFVATVDFPDGSPFATAMCLRLLLLDQVDPQVKAARAAATQWLLKQQGSNGAWISSAGIQVPYPYDLDPSKFTQWVRGGKIPPCIAFDHNGFLTTAAVLYSLSKVAQLIEE